MDSVNTTKVYQKAEPSALGPIAAAALLTPLLLLLIWHVRNQSWPNGDAANYATTAYQIFARFRDDGLAQGLVSLVGLRGWRPIIFPTLLVPYLIAFNGNVVAASAGLLLTLYSVLTFYIYKLSQLYLPQRRAVICTILVITSPILCHFDTILFSEFSWVCFSVACVYHVFRSECLKEPYHSALAGIFLGLMLADRPAESLTISAIPLGFLLTASIRAQTVKRADLLLAATLLGMSGGLLTASLFLGWLTRSWIWPSSALTVALCFIAALRRPQTYSRAHLLFWSTAAGVCVIWWANYVRPLYDWVYTTSFGYMAAITAPPHDRHASIPEMVKQIFNYYGALQLWLLLCLVGGVVLFNKWARAKSNRSPEPAGGEMASTGPGGGLVRETKLRSGRSLGIIAAGTLLPMFILYWSSGTGDPRRVIVGVTLLLLSLAIAGVGLAGPLANLRFLVVVLIALWQLYLLGAGLFTWPLVSPTLVNWSGPPLRAPIAGVDGNQLVAEILAKEVPRKSGVAVYTMALFSAANRIYEPAALTLGTVMEGSDVGVGYLWDEGRYDTVVHRLAQSGYQFLLVDSWDDPTVRQSHMPYAHFAGALLDMLKTAQSPPGLSLKYTFSVRGRTQRLFSITEAQPPLLSFEGNIAAARSGARAIATASQRGYEIGFLNDETPMPWGSAEGQGDTYAGVILPKPETIGLMRISVFSPANGQHLHDISIVAADSEGPKGPDWHIVRSRIKGMPSFMSKITVPPLPDNTAVTIEIDPADLSNGPHKIWGFECLSGYARNYLRAGTGIYVRELQMRAAEDPTVRR